MTYQANRLLRLSGSSAIFRNALKSALVAYCNERMGQNWVKVLQRINPTMVSIDF